MFHVAGGSYSGIFPSDPMFFSDPNLQQQGYDVLNNMCDFYSGLESNLQDVVTGMTLMNEPAHSMPQDGETMVRQRKFSCMISVGVCMFLCV